MQAIVNVAKGSQILFGRNHAGCTKEMSGGDEEDDVVLVDAETVLLPYVRARGTISKY